MVMNLFTRLTQALRPVPADPGGLQWRAPAHLDRGRLGEARVALDDRGRGLALWENAGSLWTMPTGPATSAALARMPFGEGTSPRLALSPRGRGFAAWVADLGEERQILGKILGAGEAIGHVLFQTPGLVHQLQVAADRRGNALVVWLHQKVGRVEAMAYAFDARQENWKAEPVVLGLPPDPGASPRLASNSREHAMVLWQARDGLFEGLMASHYWPSDRIWSDHPVPVVAHEAHHHHVAMDDHGNALALWIHASPGQPLSLLEASFYDVLAGEWGAPDILAAAHGITSPRLIMNGDGEALAAWGQSAGGEVSRLYSKAFRGRAWESEAACLDHEQGRFRDYAIDLGPDGRAGFLVVQRGAAGDQVAFRVRQGGWSAPKVMGGARGATCGSPRIAMCPQGMSLLWTQGAGAEKTLILVDSH